MSIKEIKDLIAANITCNATPDLPEMRYYGDSIPIFLWDDLQDYTNLVMALHPLPVSDHYQVKFFSATTVSEHVPWYNMQDTKGCYTAYCLEEYDDVCFLSLPTYMHATPRPIRGKLAKISLEALQKLDEYYSNTYIFSRQVISVKPSNLASPVKAYTWFNQIDQISTYDNENCEYLLDDGLDFTPFKETIEQNKKLYVVA